MGVSARNHYEVLGVPRNASALEIRRVYRTLARRYHPDVSADAEAHARFHKLSNAYEVLHDPEERARYDGSVSGGRRPVRPTAAQRAPVFAPRGSTHDVPRVIDDEAELADAWWRSPPPVVHTYGLRHSRWQFRVIICGIPFEWPRW